MVICVFIGKHGFNKIVCLKCALFFISWLFFLWFVHCSYPCISPRSEYSEAKVYSGTLACSRFLYGDRTVVTVGGTDASLMVWELVEE